MQPQTPIPTPTTQAQPQQPQQPAAPVPAQPATSTPLSHEVTYSLSWFGRSKKGVLNYDGKGTVWLIDTPTQAVVFSQPITGLGKIRRAENGLYLKPAGQFVFAMFGDARAYAVQSGGTMNLGLTGLIFSTVRANQINKESGLETWVTLLQQAGVMGANFSPNNVIKTTLKYTGIFIGVVLLIGFVVAVIMASI